MKRKLISLILGFPYTLWFNFRYLPFAQAIRLPFLLAPNVRIRKAYRGGIILINTQRYGFACIRIGFHEVEPIDTYSLHTILSVSKNGKIIFKGGGHIGRGAIIHCMGGSLSFGDNIAISGTTSIVCKYKISIGKDVQFSYDSIIIDSDAHHIWDECGKLCPNQESIEIGDKVWIAPNVTILKGCKIGNNSVIASNSLVNRKFEENNVVIGGIPAKILRHIKSWEI